jgi:hypothetical protein
MKRTLVLVLAVAALPGLRSKAAFAQDMPASSIDLGSEPTLPTFGKRGQAAILSDFNLRFDYYRYGGNAGASAQSYESVYFDPTLMYFVAKNFAVGGSVSVGHSWLPLGEASNSFGVGPRLGYNVSLGRYVSVFPRAGVSYAYGWGTGSPGGNNSSGYSLGLNFDSYFLFHPVQHFLLGLGPVLGWEAIAKQNGADASKTLHVGINFIIGGWFQLHRPKD